MPRTSGIRRRSTGNVSINMTPMIDCTFQLIIFFLLTTQLVNQELVNMVIPEPARPQVPLEEQQDPGVLVLQAVSKETPEGDPSQWDAARSGELAFYRIGLTNYAVTDRAQMIEAVRQAKASAEADGIEDFKVRIRADRRLHYTYVYRLFQVASQAGVTKMELTARLEEVQ